MCSAKELNDRKSMAYSAQLMEQNFSGDDLFLTFGYIPEQSPRSREVARFHLKSEVIDPLRRLRKAQGVPCLYAYSTRWADAETPTEHRLILSRGREGAEMLASIWCHGPVICRPLREMEDIPALVRRLYTDAGKDAPKNYKPIVHSTTVR